MLKPRTLLFSFILTVVFCTSASSCSPITGVGQSTIKSQEEYKLMEGIELAQSFIPHQAGLMGFEVYLTPAEPGSGEIGMRIRSHPDGSTELAQSRLDLNIVDHAGFYRFSFDPIKASSMNAYIAELQIIGSGSVYIANAPGETHLDGSMYKNGQPLDQQMTFQLAYSPEQAFMGLFLEVGSWLLLIIVALLLYILPGWALIDFLFAGFQSHPWPSKLGLSAGVGIALQPLLFLWTDAVGIHAGPFYAFVPLSISILYWVCKILLHRKKFKKTQLSNALRGEAFWPNLTYLIITTLILLTRFYVVRSVKAPLWADSVHHTLIVQLLLDNAGLFSSWMPYTTLDTFTYHFGLHASIASFSWATGLEAHEAMIWGAQILNALAVLAVYPLALLINRNRWSGTIAVLIAGLMLQMPMHYVNWGRFTQLAGQIILPSSVILIIHVLERRKSTYGTLILASLVWAGLALTHYRVLAIAAMVVPAFLLVSFSRQRDRINTRFLIFLPILSLLLIFPWLLRVIGSNLINLLNDTYFQSPTVVQAWLVAYNNPGSLERYQSAFAWIVLAISMQFSFWQRNQKAMLVALWWLLIILLANPQWFNLPGQGAISNFAILIAFYIPTSIFVANYFCDAILAMKMKALKDRENPRILKAQAVAVHILPTVVVIIFAFYGARGRLDVLEAHDRTLVTNPDIHAYDWIKENLPEDATFLNDFYFSSGKSIVIGADGGWWIPYFTERKVFVPPMVYRAESGIIEDSETAIAPLALQIADSGLIEPETITMLDRRGINYVYIGQQRGRASMGHSTQLDALSLLGNPYFKPIYHQDRVWIFERIDG